MKGSQPSACDLMQMHIRALYLHDERSRILSINDRHGRVAPRFFLGRTEKGNICRFRNDLPQAFCEELSSLCATEAFTISDRPRHEAEYVRILSAHAPIQKIGSGPAYWFANGIDYAAEPILIDEQNAHLLQEGLDEWIPDLFHEQPVLALIVNGRAVAICASVRITKAAHEAGVETLIAHRQKGYAAKVVSAWARAVNQMGVLPLYSTSFENVASQTVAKRLGLSKFGVDFQIT
jgi:RimJ/RimL family protein N-acetyltransferase